MTPAMKQYNEMKARHPDTILFFRMGDFYETFFEDAKITASILNIAITSRDKGPNKTPMAGIPHHALDAYLPKMIKAGKKVALCEQMEDPKTAKGLVKRDVVKIITPGTFSEDINKNNTYLVTLASSQIEHGISLVDISTGEFRLYIFRDTLHLESFLANISPSEIVLLKENHAVDTIKARFAEKLTMLAHSYTQTNHIPYKATSLGLDDHHPAFIAANIAYNYLFETQKAPLEHLSHPRVENISHCMFLDANTVQNLELVQNLRGGRDHTLIDILDKTKTGMGARMLRQWIVTPLQQKEKIEDRLDAIEELYNSGSLREQLQEKLDAVHDIEKIGSKIGMQSATPRDLLSLAQSIIQKEKFVELLQESSSTIFQNIYDTLKNLSLDALAKEILLYISQDAPLLLKEGGIINEGVNTQLDTFRKAGAEGKEWVRQMQQEEIASTKIGSLKIKYNRVFGYYIEIPTSQAGKIPLTYTRKQTLANVERFTTPRLKELEDTILGATIKGNELEYQMFIDLRKKASIHITDIKAYAHMVGLLDTLCSLATVSKEQNYVKPVILDKKEGRIAIEQGRHPVIEKTLPTGAFVPNDIFLSGNEQQLIILTGPNMIGKSTYMRQNALIILLAHIGCFVPAKSAEISIIDRIFTRVGASDNLAKGESTFMVEMNEVANILNNATSYSFVILDEVGRGTSTHDGVSIACAIAEYIHEKVGCLGIFATHYHELLDMEQQYERIANYSIQVKEKDNTIVFLHQVVKGGTDQSYGIHVASIAGLPDHVVKRAYALLDGIHKTQHKTSAQPALFVEYSNPKDKKLKEKLQSIDINAITPIEALHILQQLKDATNDE